MPKTTDTRKQRAANLFRLLEHGPYFSKSPAEGHFTAEEAHRQYVIWTDAWVMNELQDLIPELRLDKKNKGE